MRADALLGCGHQEQGGQPPGKRDFAALEYGSDRDGELLTAGRFVALVYARTVRLTLKLGELVLIGMCGVSGRSSAPGPATLAIDRSFIHTILSHAAAVQCGVTVVGGGALATPGYLAHSKAEFGTIPRIQNCATLDPVADGKGTRPTIR
jgi:hypothetical protein